MTSTIPPPGYRCPDCRLCGRETDNADGELICIHCRVGWSNSDYWRPGYRLDDEPQCAAETSPYPDQPTVAHYRYRCVLNDGHEGNHAGGRVDLPGAESVYEWPVTP